MSLYNRPAITCNFESEGTHTFIIDLPIVILFGVLFAAFEEAGFSNPAYSSRYFWHGVVFTTIFNVAVGYAILFYPDWMWMYFIENSKNTVPELIYIFLFLYYLPYAFGFYLGLDIKKFSTAAWLLLIAILAATEAALILHLFNRYSVVGTRADFLNGTATSLFSPANPIGPVMNGSVIAMIVYFFMIFFLKKRRPKGLR